MNCTPGLDVVEGAVDDLVIQYTEGVMPKVVGIVSNEQVSLKVFR